MIEYVKKLPEVFNYFFLNKISPEKVIFNSKINIDKIQHFLELKNIIDKKNFIWNGNWDTKKINISEYRNYSASFNSVYQIYQENKNFRESEEYKIKSKLILDGIKTGRAKNLIELDDYFESIDKLKKSLDSFGYKSQIDLKNINKKNDEIGVVIGSNYEIIKLQDKFGGTHRFGLCKILGIKDVVISIKAIHKKLITKNEIQKLIYQNDRAKIITLLKDIIKI
tara:strand:+ start:1437 stop:2108 length:672 start_codon:yes stop_codon:yes gene_type:complete